MNRCALLLMVSLLTTSAVAQQTPITGRSPEWIGMMERYESRLQRLALEVKRDANIVSQIVLASGELHDSQKSVAIQKAIDRIEQATKRAREEPMAPRATFLTLQLIRDTLVHAREQGEMADLVSIGKEIIGQGSSLQLALYREVSDTRTERQVLIDLQARLGQINQQLELAMMDALSATFDSVRAGRR